MRERRRRREKDIPAPTDPLLRQLRLLKGDRPLDKFVDEFNSWGEVNDWELRPRDRGRKLSYHTIQSYLLGRSTPNSWNRLLISKRILWLRYVRSHRAKALRGELRKTYRDATVTGMGNDGAFIHKDETSVIQRDKLGRPLRKRNATAR
jgi:hypothetical protein